MCIIRTGYCSPPKCAPCNGICGFICVQWPSDCGDVSIFAPVQSTSGVIERLERGARVCAVFGRRQALDAWLKSATQLIIIIGIAFESIYPMVNEPRCIATRWPLRVYNGAVLAVQSLTFIICNRKSEPLNNNHGIQNLHQWPYGWLHGVRVCMCAGNLRITCL